MKKTCSNCRLVNRPEALSCLRCQADLALVITVEPRKSRIMARTFICFLVCVAVLLGFYVSLIVSAKSLSLDQKNTVRDAVKVLKDKGFSDEAMLLENFTVFRAEDNWLNAAVAKENAYAATNFPFEIITLYSDFFTYPADDTERAAILLHETRHLLGKDEKDAYEFVWKNRKKLSWTKEHYGSSPVWENIRNQTRDNVPYLFVCDFNPYGDCTESSAGASPPS